MILTVHYSTINNDKYVIKQHLGRRAYAAAFTRVARRREMVDANEFESILKERRGQL